VQLSVQLGAGFILFYILNIETGDPPQGGESEGQIGNPPEGWESAGQYRTRNFEQQKFFKEIRQCFSLRYSAVPCSAVLLFIFSTT